MNSISNSLIVSVVIPAYNCDKTIRSALESVLSQTMSSGKFEIIVVDDGSSDSTLDICNNYAINNSNVTVLSQVNSGVSIARNTGIRHSKGKYITFLDGDDTLQKDTLEKVCDFFELNYNDIDLVTYPMKIYDDFREWPHVREKILVDSGVYDLKIIENAFAPITNVNVFVKNTSNLPTFNESLSVHEDELFNINVLVEKQKLGFCKEGAYRYKQSESSVSSTKMHPKFHFNENMTFWEDLFSRFPVKEIPICVQALFLHELNWKKKRNVLYPSHLDAKEFERALERIEKLVKKLDDHLISQSLRTTDKFKHYLFLLKYGNKLSYVFIDGDVVVSCDGVPLLRCVAARAVISKTKIDEDGFVLEGSIESLVADLLMESDNPILIMGSNDIDVKIKYEPWNTAQPFILCNKNCLFSIRVPLSRREQFTFNVMIGKGQFECPFDFIDGSNLNSELGIDSFYRGGYYLRYSDSSRIISLRKASSIFYYKSWLHNSRAVFTSKSDKLPARIVNGLLRHAENAPVLFVGETNASDDPMYQVFRNFESENSESNKYYIYKKDLSSMQLTVGNVIKFNSKKHRRLHVHASKIFVNSAVLSSYSPYAQSSINAMSDLVFYELVVCNGGE